VVNAKATGARLAYGALFVFVVPVGLVFWAAAADAVVPLRAIRSTAISTVPVALGLVLMAWGAHDLIARGGGLPMNAFPPPRFVRSGIFMWIRNPIYIGFGLVCAGASLAVGSPAGLWLVTPVVCLACAALVFGFERHDLARRFGEEALRPPLLSLPRGDREAPAAAHRVAVFLWVFIPWLVAYYAVKAVGIAPDAFETALAFERRWPVLQWTEILYASTYLVVPVTALIIHTQRDLRRFAVQAALAIPVVTLIWLTVPVVVVNRPFTVAHPLGWLLAFEQGHSNGGAACPASHVLWGLIVAEACAANARGAKRRLWAWAGWTWASLMTVSCLTTGMHTVIDVGVAILLFLPLRRYEAVWTSIRGTAERVANSWQEWRIGPLRVINHGGWAAAAGGVGLAVAGSAAGPDRLGAVILIGVCVLVGAGLWAQWLEGSSKLLRPFGWYGGVLGGVLGAFAAGAMGAPILTLLAAFAIGAPWTQLLGRFRCLVQGCCHGGPAPASVGIRYWHLRSRVTKAHLGGSPVHATPLYSIAGNVVLGVIIVRLRVLAASDTLVIGVFLILNGIARFVEESFRAEPQTPVVAGLHSYQWIAIVSVLSGVVCTTLPVGLASVGFAPLDLPLAGAALAMAFACLIAFGVDFPGSNRPFSRLAAAD
jgi:protein-S-isoprenylcysteine O-methyltransferase Ste14